MAKAEWYRKRGKKEICFEMEFFWLGKGKNGKGILDMAVEAQGNLYPLLFCGVLLMN